MLPAMSTSSRSRSFEMERASISETTMWSSMMATRIGVTDEFSIGLYDSERFRKEPCESRVFLGDVLPIFCFLPLDFTVDKRLSSDLSSSTNFTSC